MSLLFRLIKRWDEKACGVLCRTAVNIVSTVLVSKQASSNLLSAAGCDWAIVSDQLRVDRQRSVAMMADEDSKPVRFGVSWDRVCLCRLELVADPRSVNEQNSCAPERN